MASLSEDRVALTIGRLTLRLMAAEQEAEELRGLYVRQSQSLDDLQAIIDKKEEAEANVVRPEG